METLRLSAMKDLPDEVITPEFLFEMGEAVVVDVKPDVSTLRALQARRRVPVGDYVALPRNRALSESQDR